VEPRRQAAVQQAHVLATFLLRPLCSTMGPDSRTTTPPSDSGERRRRC